MALKLMYITNRPEIGLIAEKSGVDRVFVDMEYIGKELRQKGLDSVKNHHTERDVEVMRSVLKKSELLVRVNPIHEATESYCSSQEEIENVIAAGADIVMLPYFKTVEEVKQFISIVKGRAKVLLLLETPEAVDGIDEILSVPGIDEIHIGINDLSLGYNKSFMFELLIDGTVDYLCSKIRETGIPYGFGGVASIGTGKLPAELVIKEHYRLGSSMVILSRSFCNIFMETDFDNIKSRFEVGVHNIRLLEEEIMENDQFYDADHKMVVGYVNKIVEEIKNQKES